MKRKFDEKTVSSRCAMQGFLIRLNHDKSVVSGVGNRVSGENHHLTLNYWQLSHMQ